MVVNPSGPHHRDRCRTSRERLEHQLPWGADDPGDHDLAVRGRVLGLAAATGRRHRWFLLPCLFQVLHVLVQPVEALAPEPLEAAQPLVDRPQPAGVQAVQPLLARPADPHQPDLPEHPQVLGRLRLAHPQVPRQLGHRPLAAPQQHQDLPPLRLGDRVERVRGRRRSCHGSHHMPISECVNASRSAGRKGATSKRPDCHQRLPAAARPVGLPARGWPGPAAALGVSRLRAWCTPCRDAIRRSGC